MGRDESKSAIAATRMESSRRLYTALNSGDIDAALALMCPDVDWANAVQGGREHGHAAVRRHWEQVSEMFAFRLMPLQMQTDRKGRVVVDAHQAIRDAAGKPLAHQRVRHVFTFRDELIRRMDIHDPPPGAPPMGRLSSGSGPA